MGRFLLTAGLAFLSALSLCAQSDELQPVDSLLSSSLIRLTDGRVVRLIGIGLPPSTPAADCREHLRQLIGTNPVRLVADTILLDRGSDTLERYLYVDSVMVNQKMIADGFAVPSSVKHSLQDEFQALLTLRESTNDGHHIESASKESSSEGESSSASTSVQCSGRTKKGTRCKRMTANASGKCWQHE